MTLRALSVLDRVATILVLFAAATAAGGGCTPIERQNGEAVSGSVGNDLDPVPVPRPGDSLPDLAYVDQGARDHRLSDHRGHAVVLTFVSRHCVSDGSCRELPARLADARRFLRDDLVARSTFVVVSTDPLGDADGELERAIPLAAEDLATLHLAIADEPDLRTLLDASGVVVWRTADGTTEHNYETLVLAPSGRIADRFPGIEGWSSDDLRAAVAAAALRAHR